MENFDEYRGKLFVDLSSHRAAEKNDASLIVTITSFAHRTPERTRMNCADAFH